MTVTSPSEREKTESEKKKQNNQFVAPPLKKKRSKFQVFDSFPSSNWRRTDLASIIRPWYRRRLCTNSAITRNPRIRFTSPSRGREEKLHGSRENENKSTKHVEYSVF